MAIDLVFYGTIVHSLSLPTTNNNNNNNNVGQNNANNNQEGESFLEIIAKGLIGIDEKGIIVFVEKNVENESQIKIAGEKYGFASEKVVHLGKRYIY